MIADPQPSLIMIQFLQWLADRPRTREDVMEAWRSSCPRFPVWEDARADGLVRQCGGEAVIQIRVGNIRLDGDNHMSGDIQGERLTPREF